MAADEAWSPRRASLRRALAQSVPLATEHAFSFVVGNVGCAIALTAFLLLMFGVPILVLASPILALPTSALMRLAVSAVRSGVPTLEMARQELRRLPLRKIGLAAVQLLAIGVGIANIGLAGRIGGLVGILSGAVAAYAIAVTAMIAIAVWPIVCDPLRAAPVRDQLRLALAITVRRPIPLAVLALICGVAAFVSIQLLVPALFLPAIVMLAIAGYVVPLADELLPPTAT